MRLAQGSGHRRLAAAAGGFTLLVGLVGLVAWLLKLPQLRGAVDGHVDMKANTALALTLGGGSLLAQAWGRGRTAAAVAALAAAAIGIATLAEYLLGAQLGIDEFLFEDPGAGHTMHPGRMAPQAALATTLLGVALAGSATRRLAPSLIEWLSIGVFLMCLVAVLGYAYGGRSLTSLPSSTPIAFPTAFALLILSAGTGLVGGAKGGIAGALGGQRIGSVIARRLLVATVFAVPLIGWLRVVGEQEGLYDARTGDALYGVVFVFLLATGLVSMVRPLNRAQAARERMAMIEQQMAAIVRWSEEAIFSVDREGRISSWNAGAERLYCRSADEAVGQPLTVLTAGAEPADGAAPGTYVRHVRGDGAIIDVELACSALHDADGALIGSAIIARDVTERRRADDAARAARAEAEQANNAKTEFLSRMSHELRTPLNAILGFGQLLDADDLGEEQKENVDYILKAGRHLLGLIDEVLQVSRIESGTLTMSPEPVDVAVAVKDAIGMIGPLAASKQIEIRTDLDEDPGCHVHADQQRFKQVLLNLLSNAVKYNRLGGSITVRSLADDGYLRLDVVDTGYGIRGDQLPRLFTPFERLGAEHGPEEGTGLGLALSRRLVELMGGTVSVESHPGEGSTFTIHLPLADGRQNAHEHRDDGRWTAASPRPGHNVLYIEDNVSNFRLIERVLNRHPEISLLPAMQGSIGLDLAAQHPIDVILLDLHLPDMSGEDVLHRLRSDPRSAQIPVVILSADATPGRLERLVEAGAVAWLSKPLDIHEFMRVVDRALGRSRVA